jgi:hypothetical protein
MEQSPSEADSRSGSQETPLFMEPNGSLLCSQEPAIYTYLN